MNPTIKVGTYTGNTAAIDIVLGFVPDYVRVINITDGTHAWEWFKGMTAGHAFQNANHGTVQNGVISSNGISPVEGANGAGFRVGTALSTDAKVYRYVAMRSGAGAA
jgi:hypothetical protein